MSRERKLTIAIAIVVPLLVVGGVLAVTSPDMPDVGPDKLAAAPGDGVVPVSTTAAGCGCEWCAGDCQGICDHDCAGCCHGEGIQSGGCWGPCGSAPASSVSPRSGCCYPRTDNVVTPPAGQRYGCGWCR